MTDAIHRGDLDAAERYVHSEPTSWHEPSARGDTPLRTAIRGNKRDLVQFFLSVATDPNVSVDDGYTCLLTAIDSESPESHFIVDDLNKVGADIEATGING